MCARAYGLGYRVLALALLLFLFCTIGLGSPGALAACPNGWTVNTEGYCIPPACSPTPLERCVERCDYCTRKKGIYCMCCAKKLSCLDPANAVDSKKAAACQPGYVWRERFEGDAVCVTPDQRFKLENGTCRSGYVWRDSFPGDGVCVTPAQRAIAKGKKNPPAQKPSNDVLKQPN